MNLKTDIDSLLAVIGPFLDVYRHVEVAFVSIKNAGTTRLFSGRVVLHVPHPGLAKTQFTFESDHISSARDLIPVTRQQIDQILASCASGSLDLPGAHQQLEKRPHIGLDASVMLFNQSVPAGTARVPSVVIRGAIKHELLTAAGGNDALDWELRAATPPFESLSELLMSCGLPGLLQMGDMCQLELVAMAPAAVASNSIMTGGKATITIVAAQGVETDAVQLGYRMLRAGRMERSALKGTSLQWQNEEGIQKAVCEIETKDAPNLQAFLSYRGVALHQWWVSDATKAINPRLATHQAVDPDLKMLRDLLLAPENGVRFESAVGLLTFVCGFSPASYGLLPRMREFADLTVATPSNRIGVVECTIGLPGLKDKLSKLKQRALRVRQQMDSAGLQHLEVLPVLVTACPRAELVVDASTAAEHGIAIVARENIESLLLRASYSPNPEALFDEAKTLIPHGVS